MGVIMGNKRGDDFANQTSLWFLGHEAASDMKGALALLERTGGTLNTRMA